MKAFYQQRRLGFISAAVAAVSLACASAAPEKDMKPDQLSACTVFQVSEWHNHDMAYHETLINNPERVEKLREWIRRCAWPPIDVNKTGDVYPNWVIKGGKDSHTLTVKVPVYGFIDRGMTAIHVKEKDREELMRILEAKEP